MGFGSSVERRGKEMLFFFFNHFGKCWKGRRRLGERRAELAASPIRKDWFNEEGSVSGTSKRKQ